MSRLGISRFTWERRRAVACVLFLASLAVAADAVSAADAAGDAIDQFRDDWHARRAAVQSVRYRVKGTMTYLKGRLAYPPDPALPPDAQVPQPTADYAAPYESTWLIDFARARLQHSTTTEGFLLSEVRFVPESSQVCYGGEAFWELERHAFHGAGIRPGSVESSELRKYGERYSHFIMMPVDFPVLWAHGIPIRWNQWRTGTIKSRDPLADLPIAYDGEERLDAVSCRVFVLDSLQANHLKFWVDPQRQHALVRAEWHGPSDQGIIARFDFQLTSRDRDWYPSAWSAQTFASFPGDAPGEDRQRLASTVASIRVEELDLNPPVSDSDFQPVLEPGLRVREIETGVVQIIGPDAKTPIDLARPQAKAGSAALRNALIGVAVAAVVLTGVVIVVRRRRR